MKDKLSAGILITLIFSIALAIAFENAKAQEGLFRFASDLEPTFGASPRILTSGQVGSGPTSGYVLQTNGATSAWVATSSLGISGGGGSALEVLDEASSLSSAVESIDFEGAGVTATAVGNAITVNIPGGSGGGGSGGGTWSTTTSQVAGQLINYPNNNDDVVVIGSSASTSGEFYFDPNVPEWKVSGALQSQLISASTATSTFAQGINITAGCFAVGGSCLNLALDDLSDNDTGDLAEGSNLYYTAARVNALINASTTISKLGQSIDISDETNLAGDSEIVLTGDTLSIASSIARDSELHDAVTVTDSSEIDFTLSTQNITASLVSGSIDETKLDTSTNASLDLADSAVQSTDIDTESELETLLTDVTNVFTNNDGVLNQTHTGEVTGATALTIANNIIEAVNIEATNTEADGDLMTYDSGSGGFTFESPSELCEAITGGSGLCDGVDSTGSGGSGLATSTPIADTYVIYGTSASDVGAESDFTYNDATNVLNFVYGSSTAFTATSLFGSLIGNADTATALASNGANCTSGSAPLGVDASGAVESCFDVWTEAENTSASYFNVAGTNLNSSGNTVNLDDTIELTGASTTYATTSSLLVNNSGQVNGDLRINNQVGIGGAPHSSAGLFITIDGSTIQRGVRISANDVSTVAHNVFVSGDAERRYTVRGDGTIEWGSGSASADTNLYRIGASSLGTDDLFTAAQGFLTSAQSDFGMVSTTDATIDGFLDVTGSATSTFSNGINISAGCFSVGGSCLAFLLEDDATPSLGGNLALSGNALTEVFEAAETFSAGQVGVLGNGGMYLADADLASTTRGLVAVAAESISAGGYGTFILWGTYTTSGLTQGDTWYVSTTAGEATTTAPSATGDQVKIIGYSASSTAFFVDVDKTYVEIP